MSGRSILYLLRKNGEKISAGKSVDLAESSFFISPWTMRILKEFTRDCVSYMQNFQGQRTSFPLKIRKKLVNGYVVLSLRIERKKNSIRVDTFGKETV